MKAFTSSILLFAAMTACGPTTAVVDPSLDLLGDVVRSIQLAEVEVEIWEQEVEQLRPRLADDPEAVRLFLLPKPDMEEVQAIRKRVEILISTIPRLTPEVLLPLLSEELDRADDAVSAYRGPRNTIFAIAEERWQEK